MRGDRNRIETQDKAISAVFIVVKGKKDGEMLLRCDIAMEHGVLKIVKSVEKEGTVVRPAVAYIGMTAYSMLLANINMQGSRSALTKLFSQSHK